MQSPRLVRATPDNGVFRRLKEEWDAQLANEDAPTDYYAPMMEHAERISAEHPQDARYGIFVLVQEDDHGDVIAHEGLIHINHAFPKTSDATLRVVWNLIAPRYSYEEVSEAQLARIFAAFLTESLALCGTDMQSRHMRMYLGNAVDREFATLAVAFLEPAHPKFAFAVRGGWLHITQKLRDGGTDAR